MTQTNVISSSPTIAQHLSSLAAAVRGLRVSRGNGRLSMRDVPGRLRQVELAIGALPLATDHYALASNRLANARLYWKRGELGAMRWELQQLSRTVARVLRVTR